MTHLTLHPSSLLANTLVVEHNGAAVQVWGLHGHCAFAWETWDAANIRAGLCSSLWLQDKGTDSSNGHDVLRALTPFLLHSLSVFLSLSILACAVGAANLSIILHPVNNILSPCTSSLLSLCCHDKEHVGVTCSDPPPSLYWIQLEAERDLYTSTAVYNLSLFYIQTGAHFFSFSLSALHVVWAADLPSLLIHN